MTQLTERQLFCMDDEELQKIDPLVMNLVIAKGIPSLADLDVGQYVRKADWWKNRFSGWLPTMEREFRRTPHKWENDIILFRLGMMCQFLDLEMKIRYREDQKNVKEILYLNPGDLFLHGVMDSRQGTCGNMSALHVAIGWRMKWPVSLACFSSHFVCRYDDGTNVRNMETTDTGRGGFSCATDEEYCQPKEVPPQSIACGSDLNTLTPREVLGVFISLRGRHYRDIAFAARDQGDPKETHHWLGLAEKEFLLARYLFPNNWNIYQKGIGVSVMRGEQLFTLADAGHPFHLGQWLIKEYGPPVPPPPRKVQPLVG